MGFKTSQSNNYNQYKVGGLIFESEDDYLLFKAIDSYISQTVKSVEDGSIDLKEYFNKINRINVKESYFDAREEMYGLFKNATHLLCYEGTRFVTDYKVGRYFFSKINIIEYCDSDSD